jgi:CheY-like chemotaxis protein
MSMTKRVILIVDDVPLIRLAAMDLLGDAGFEVLEAGSADEAIGILENRQDIALVLTDVQMPGTMDGIKLSHFIRNRWPPVRLIVVSGKDLIHESLLPEGARFFFKPYDHNKVIDAIVAMLAAA